MKKNKIYGLIGKNISYSFSREYFSNKFKTEKISSKYLNFDLIDINQITGSVYEYAYNEVNEHYKTTFGDSNVNDDI